MLINFLVCSSEALHFEEGSAYTIKGVETLLREHVEAESPCAVVLPLEIALTLQLVKVEVKPGWLNTNEADGKGKSKEELVDAVRKHYVSCGVTIDDTDLIKFLEDDEANVPVVTFTDEKGFQVADVYNFEKVYVDEDGDTLSVEFVEEALLNS